MLKISNYEDLVTHKVTCASAAALPYWKLSFNVQLQLQGWSLVSESVAVAFAVFWHSREEIGTNLFVSQISRKLPLDHPSAFFLRERAKLSSSASPHRLCALGPWLLCFGPLAVVLWWKAILSGLFTSFMNWEKIPNQYYRCGQGDNYFPQPAGHASEVAHWVLSSICTEYIAGLWSTWHSLKSPGPSAGVLLCQSLPSPYWCFVTPKVEISTCL